MAICRKFIYYALTVTIILFLINKTYSIEVREGEQECEIHLAHFVEQANQILASSESQLEKKRKLKNLKKQAQTLMNDQRELQCLSQFNQMVDLIRHDPEKYHPKMRAIRDPVTIRKARNEVSTRYEYYAY